LYFCNYEHHLFILRSKARSCSFTRRFPLFLLEVIIMFVDFLLCAKSFVNYQDEWDTSIDFKELRIWRGWFFQKEGIHGRNTQLPGIRSALECGNADITHEHQGFMRKTMNEAGLFATRGADLSPWGTLMETLRTSILESTISLPLWKAGCDRIWFRKERRWRTWQHCVFQTLS